MAAEVEGMLAAVRRPVVAAAAPETEPGLRCELCSEPIAERHRHLVDLEERGLRCVCHACSILFDRREAGWGHYRLVPDRVVRLDEFDLPDPLWRAFQVPVDMAFFFHDSAVGRVVAFYPGPMGAVESRLELARWQELVERNPALGGMEEDVEALLANRTGDGSPSYWLVPVDVCYELVALIRESWKGLGGGSEVWERLERFFRALDGRDSTRPGKHDGEAAPGPVHGEMTTTAGED